MITQIWESNESSKLVKTNRHVGRKLKKLYWTEFNTYIHSVPGKVDEEGYVHITFDDFINWLRQHKGYRVKVLKNLAPHQKPRKDFTL